MSISKRTLVRDDGMGGILIRRDAGFVRSGVTDPSGDGVFLRPSVGAVRITGNPSKDDSRVVFVTVPFEASVYADVDAAARSIAKSPSRAEVSMDVDSKAHHSNKTERESRCVSPVATVVRNEKRVAAESRNVLAVGSMSSVEVRRGR